MVMTSRRQVSLLVEQVAAIEEGLSLCLSLMACSPPCEVLLTRFFLVLPEQTLVAFCCCATSARDCVPQATLLIALHLFAAGESEPRGSLTRETASPIV